MRRYITTALLAIVAVMLLTAPALAAYYCTITVTESDGNSYDMLPVAASMDIDYLADNNYIEPDGRDTRVRTVGGQDVPFMLVDDKVLFASAINENRQNTFRLSTGNALIDNFNVVTGYGGYVTTSDHADLEIGNNFEITYDGYVDTGVADDILNKDTALNMASDGAGNIEATIHHLETSIEQTSRDHLEKLYNGSYIRAGQRIDNFPASTIIKLSFYLLKQGSPTGTAYARIRTVSGDTIIGTMGTIDVSTLTGSWVWYDFTTAVENPSAQDLRFSIEYNGGDSSNYIDVGLDTNDLTTGVYTHYDSSWTDNSARDCTFKIDYTTVAISVSAAVSAGEHEIKLTGDGTNGKLYIDGIEKDSDLFSGKTTADVSSNWIIGSYITPYFTYHHKVGATDRIDYKPDSIITGTTLPNELAAGTHDGTITYGTEPSGIAVATSGLQTYEVSYPTDLDVDIPTIITPTTAPMFDVDLEKLSYNPLQPLVAVIAEETNLTERIVWIVGGFLLLICAVILVLWKTEGQLFFTALVGLGVSIMCYTSGVFPLWTVILWIFGLVAAAAYEKVISL